MAGGKWIEGLTDETPVVDAARHVLTVRLDSVRERIPPLLQAQEDPEPVHQVRVATRRAGAALTIFKECLPRSTRRGVKAWLRELRQAASAARDWDVFLLELNRWQTDHPRTPRAGLDYLVGYGAGQRAAAQAPLDAVVTNATETAEDVQTNTLDSLRKPRDRSLKTFGDLTRRWLSAAITDWEASASGDLDNPEHLHQVRIEGKRLRYAMEVFACNQAPEFRTSSYARIEEMLEILGGAHDSHVMASRLQVLSSRLPFLDPKEAQRYRTGIEGWHKYHVERYATEKIRFLEWWKTWRHQGESLAIKKMILDPRHLGCGSSKTP